MRAALRVQQLYADAGDLSAFAEADEAFHRTIVAAGRNELTLGFYATLADRQRRMSVRALGPTPGQLPVVLREHEALIAIIDAGDDVAFASALRDHLSGTHRR
jgi:DNA-binding GntR family transcriptional regulator